MNLYAKFSTAESFVTFHFFWKGDCIKVQNEEDLQTTTTVCMKEKL